MFKKNQGTFKSLELKINIIMYSFTFVKNREENYE